MINFERQLFDLIASVSGEDRQGTAFSQALVERIVGQFGGPLRIAGAAILSRDGDRYQPGFRAGAEVWDRLDGLLAVRGLQRRLGRERWWIHRGLHLPAGDAPGWYDLIVIPFDRELACLLAVMTESLAGEEGQQREGCFQVMGQLIRLFVDRHHHRSRLQEILTLAGQQQLSLLPPELPAIPGYSLAAASVPAEEVGGDYYQAFSMGGAGGGFAIADAKGKGFEAAMQVTGLHAALRVVNETQFKLVHKVGLLNRSLVQAGDFRNLISLFLAEFDAFGRLLYVNCSHPPALWVRPRAVEALSEGGRFLGLDARGEYRFGIAQLQPGDLLVTYTDGWSELFNDKGEEFGSERLRDLLAGCHGAEPQAIMSTIQSAADAFRGEAGFQDDRTLFIVRKD